LLAQVRSAASCTPSLRARAALCVALTRGCPNVSSQAAGSSRPPALRHDNGAAVKIFFDVDGVLIDGWHRKPERRRPWDARIERDLGIDRAGFATAFFGAPAGGGRSLMQACVGGQRDLKKALAAVLPALGYDGSVDAFVRYWFENDAQINRDVLAVVDRLARHAQVELYLATGQEHHRAIGPAERPLLFDDDEEVVMLGRASGWDASVLDTVDDLIGHPRLARLL
jgi:putative hydrolase of the HAD superfamily